MIMEVCIVKNKEYLKKEPFQRKMFIDCLLSSKVDLIEQTISPCHKQSSTNQDHL